MNSGPGLEIKAYKEVYMLMIVVASEGFPAFIRYTNQS